MSAQQSEGGAPGAFEGKGKGKASEQFQERVEDDDSSDEESVAEEPEEPEEEDDDNMEEIDTDNIISGGRRTRGKNIDFAKAAQDNPEAEDDDEDDDEDFEAPDEDEEMQG